MSFGWICFYYGIFVLFTEVAADIRVLYDTKEAKSDLKWEKHPANGWEELSGLDENGQPIRFHQVCNTGDDKQNNWIRSPFIMSNFALRAYVDVSYSMVKSNSYRETFTLYYYQSNDDVASSTFPPWRERPYVKIDTVAAGTRYDPESNSGINVKTFGIGPLQRKGFYIAAQDQGACMSLIAVRVYYYYCPETTHNLAYFRETLPGSEIASLVSVDGKCVTNAVYKDGEIPKYRCNGDGEWQVPTGTCQCRAGYEPNLSRNACEPCTRGYYKYSEGNQRCRKCPPNSHSHSTGLSSCTCRMGFFRAKQDSVSQGCSQPPSKPRNVTAAIVDEVANISWLMPTRDGGRYTVKFDISCFDCDENYQRCRICPETIRYSPSNKHLPGTSVRVSGLQKSNFYKLRVSSVNAITEETKGKQCFEEVQFTTNDGMVSKPTDVEVVSNVDGAITLSWNPPSAFKEKITAYQILVTPLENDDSSTDQSKNQQAPRWVKGTNATITDLPQTDSYSIKIRAKTANGFGLYSKPLIFNKQEGKTTTEKMTEQEGSGRIIGIVAGVLSIVAIVVAVIIYKVYRSRNGYSAGKANKSNVDNFNETGMDEGLVASGSSRTTYADYRDPERKVREIAKQIEPKNVIVEKVIGKGEFGEVCRGKLVEGKSVSIVAIKRLKNGASIIDQTTLLREAVTMAQFKHPNILQLKGVVTKSVPTMIISEFLENGSLDKLLQAKRGQFTVIELTKMLHGISSGMRYLSDMQYVHRDLAARNILVDSNYICKISDFGLSRNIENDPRATYTTQGGKIPIRWTAPECFRYREFTSASDAWSYGIVMWEVMSYGEKPYWDMTNEHVTESIESGFRLPAPQGCPRALHRLMLDCWSYDSSARPTFREIFIRLKRFIAQPELLVDCASSDTNSELLHNDATNELPTRSLTLRQWLEYLKLESYSQSFLDHGIRDLSEVLCLSLEDMERLGIDQDVHRSRLQSGIETLQRHLNNDSLTSSNGTLPDQQSNSQDADDSTT